MERIRCYEEENNDRDKDISLHNRQSVENTTLPSAKSILLRDNLTEPTGKLGLFPTLVFVGLTQETCVELADFGNQLCKQSQMLFEREEDVWKLSFTFEQVKQLNRTTIPHPNALPAHISLSRTVFLGDVYMESFIQTLKRVTRIDYFQLKDRVQRLELFQNDENNSSFIGFLLEDGKDLVQDWIGQVDKVMQMFHLPIFYCPAVPHVTLAKSSLQQWPKDVVSIV
ncbi:U6 snRNA phosphodiesterase [Galdieria sulphuraria]|nr:U6 snRNA phosphodiesterase [Galdieria sulphuraria]